MSACTVSLPCHLFHVFIVLIHRCVCIEQVLHAGEGHGADWTAIKRARVLRGLKAREACVPGECEAIHKAVSLA